MAKRKKSKSASKSVGNSFARLITSIWRFIAKGLGNSVRFLARGARDLDPVHQRDGLAFLILILALIATAGTWFNADNIVGRNVYSVVYGGFGRLGVLTPVLLIYFAFRLFRVPDDSQATGRWRRHTDGVKFFGMRSSMGISGFPCQTRGHPQLAGNGSPFPPGFR